MRDLDDWVSSRRLVRCMRATWQRLCHSPSGSPVCGWRRMWLTFICMCAPPCYHWLQWLPASCTEVPLLVEGGGDPASILNTQQTPSRTLSIAPASPGRLPTVRFVSVRARKTEALKIALLNPQGFNSCRPTLYHLSRARQAKAEKEKKKWWRHTGGLGWGRRKQMGKETTVRLQGAKGGNKA